MPDATAPPKLLCGECQAHPPPFDRCLAAVEYSPLTGKLVNNLKHQQNLAALRPITSELVSMITAEDQHAIDLILPIPLHKKRLFKRGFNQSVEIAKTLAKTFDIAMDSHSLERQSNDPPQQGKNRSERQKSLMKSFTVSRPLTGLRVAIIDDVVTTTATCGAATHAVIKAGAIGVDIWCFARTPND